MKNTIVSLVLIMGLGISVASAQSGNAPVEKQKTILAPAKAVPANSVKKTTAQTGNDAEMKELSQRMSNLMKDPAEMEKAKTSGEYDKIRARLNEMRKAMTAPAAESNN